MQLQWLQKIGEILENSLRAIPSLVAVKSYQQQQQKQQQQSYRSSTRILHYTYVLNPDVLFWLFHSPTFEF